MRVFLDTNVIVAAVAARGLCADVVREVLARHELVVSQALLEEVASVLSEKIGLPPGLISEVTSMLRDGADLAAPAGSADPRLNDQADRALVSAALNGNASVFVTGDAQILACHEIGSMAIVSPRGFWELVKANFKK